MMHLPVIRPLPPRVFLALVSLLITAPAAASGLVGRMFCDGAAMDGATVSALDNDTQVPMDVATSDVAGDYELVLPEGIYDLVVTPPAGVPCNGATIQNRPVNGTTNYNIVLVAQAPPPPGQVTISGTVTVDGVPLPGIDVWLRLPGFSGAYIAGSSDSQGHYSHTVVAGTYSINPFGDLPQVGTFPRSVECYTPQTAFTTSTIVDFDAVTSILTGSVHGNTTGNPAPGITVVYAINVTGPSYTCAARGQVQTASDGRFGPEYVLAGGAGNVRSNAVTGAWGSASVDVATLGHGQTLDVPLVVSEVVNWKVSGRVLKSDGTPIAGMSARLMNGGGFGATFSGSTNAEGYYEITAPAGTYFLLLDVGNGAIPGVPWQLECWEQDYVLDGNRIKDFTVHTGTVSGTLTLAGNGAPVEGSTARITTNFDVPGGGLCRGYEAVPTDAAGHFGPSLQVAPSSGKVEVSARQGVHEAGLQTFTAAAGSDTDVDLSVVGVVNHGIHGTFTGNDGLGFGGAWIRIFGQGGFRPIAETFTAADGSYSITVPAGTYRVVMDADGVAGAPDHISCWRNDVVVDGSTQVDIALDWVEVSGTVTTSASIPVAGVTVIGSSMRSTSEGGFQTYDERDTTDVDGGYFLRLTPGNATFKVQPPSGSGFSTPSDIPVTLVGALVQDVVLLLPDTVAPSIVGQPIVIHHSNRSVSIQWTTSEPTRGHLDYEQGTVLDGAALTVDTTPYVTGHIVTLRDLVPATTYAFRITSHDRGGNPVTSAVLTFTTLVAADEEPPVIVGAPRVIYVAPTLIRVSWQTDEPATSSVSYGLPGAPALGTVASDASALVHDVLVGGLTPGTTYELTVSSSDPDDNGPTTAGPIAQTTPTSGDATAPQVTNLRASCVSDVTVGVCWDTDEPATSDVTYQNLTTQAVAETSSADLDTSRCMTLTNLAPATDYRITVASADGGANSGTGGPITVTTRADASAGAPVVSDLVARYASPTSALVTWTTDVPASSVVYYGASAGELGLVAGDASTAATAHAVLVSGLAPGAAVYVAVSSTDPCGAAGSSGPIPVSDVDECEVDNGGCDEGCENTNGGFACTCPDGFQPGADGTSCIEIGICPPEATGACSLETPLVFYGTVADVDGVAVGSFRCVREVDGEITCDTDEDGYLDVSDVLWCGP